MSFHVRAITLLAMANLFGVVSFCAPDDSLQPPQLRLPTTVAPVSYRAQLQLDPAQTSFSGHIAIQIEVKQSIKIIWLNANHIDVARAALKEDGATLTPKVIPGGDDFIGLAFDSPVKSGTAELELTYTGHLRLQDSSGVFRMEDNGNKYIFTQFEDTDARAAFPCFDEPNYKVPWQLTLTIPKTDAAVSNTPIAKEGTNGERKVLVFEQTKPLPSYLVAFAVGPFDFVPAGFAGKKHIPVRIVTPKGHAADAKYAAEVAATILTRLEDYFGIPFPYEKSDQVAIPVTFGFGAMENAGMVTYAQNILLANPKRDNTTRQRLCASVAAHELAHQWFGDLVTMDWWNDIWLNEAFATWTEQKILAEWKPEWQTRVSDVNSKLGAETEDTLLSARKIRQEIKTKDDISNAFDGITYQKGAAVIGMFESWVGAPDFRKGVQSYLRKYAFRNASAPEFLDAVSAAIGKNIKEPFSTFLNQAGVPLLSIALDCHSGTPSLHLEQRRSLSVGTKDPNSQAWQIPVCVRFGSGETGQSACSLMTDPRSDWKLPTAACPTWVEANNQAVGYYRVAYDGKLLSSLTEGNVSERLSPAERVDLMGNAEALAKTGQVPTADALRLVQTFHADRERYVVERAIRIADMPREHLVPEKLMPEYQRFLQQNFQARARELGWVPKAGESDDTRLLRPMLLRTVATYAGDGQLAKEARELTEKWFTDHSAISTDTTAAVLSTTAYYGDKNLFDRMLAEFKKTHDRQERRWIMTALTSFRDPAAIEAGMQAVAGGQVSFIEGSQLLYAGQQQAATRHIAFDFMQAHFAEIAAKRPTGGGADAGARFPNAGSSYCNAESRDALKAFFQPRVGDFVGAPRMLAQVLERINSCIASRAQQEPSVAAFLEQYGQ